MAALRRCTRAWPTAAAAALLLCSSQLALCWGAPTRPTAAGRGALHPRHTYRGGWPAQGRKPAFTCSLPAARHTSRQWHTVARAPVTGAAPSMTTAIRRRSMYVGTPDAAAPRPAWERLPGVTLVGTSSDRAPHELVMPSLQLSEGEKALFRLLIQVVEEEALGTTLRVAGGWVRDKLLGIGPGSSPVENAEGTSGGCNGIDNKMDVDIALDNCLGKGFAETVNKHLIRKGMGTHAVGVVSKNPEKSKHLETATMHLLGFSIDFVNLRTESYTSDSRIPNMGIGTPEDDAYRRDLTINALFYNINTGRVEDFTGRGLADLAAGVINTPLPAVDTLLDDPLRVLRSIRFASRLRFDMSLELLEACKDPEVHAALAHKVSYERIGVEVDQMVRSHDPLRAFTFICKLGLAPIVFALPPPDAMGCEAGCSGCSVPPADGEPLHLDTEAIFSQALVYLKNMHHLLGDLSLAASGLSLPSNPEAAVQERRLALYSAFLLPFAATHYRESTRSERAAAAKPHPVARFIMGDALKLRARDAEQVTRLHAAALDFQLLLRRTVGGPITDANCGLVRPDRAALGLILRRVGPLWRMALLLALTGDLGTQHILDSAFLDRRDKEADSAIAAAYACLAQQVQSMGLVGETPAWELKPAIDGDGIGRLLPGLPRGPVFKEVLEEQIGWMLSNPGCTQAEVQAFVVGKYERYLCPRGKSASSSTTRGAADKKQDGGRTAGSAAAV